jgi:hypothetical protein
MAGKGKVEITHATAQHIQRSSEMNSLATALLAMESCPKQRSAWIGAEHSKTWGKIWNIVL